MMEMQQRLSQFTDSANSNNNDSNNDRLTPFSSAVDDLTFPRYDNDDDDNDPLEYSPFNNNNNNDNNNNNNLSTDDKAQEAPAWITAPFAQDNLASQVSLNKFQQQLAGDWNQRILRQERYAPPPTTPTSSFPPPSSEFTGVDWGEDDWRNTSDSLESSFISRPATTYPTDLSATDTPFPSNNPNGIEAEEFLKEIDNDYQQLRAKVVSFLSQRTQQQQQQQQPQPEQVSHTTVQQLTTPLELPDTLQIEDSNIISEDQSPLTVGLLGNRRRYWPGGDWKKKQRSVL